MSSQDRSASESAAAGFLLGRIDYERTPPSGSASGTFRLARMQDLLHRLGNPQLKLPSVHIAGSKGKGSTAVMSATMLQAAGYRVGLFTSPHLHRFEERIQVDGEPIPPDRFESLVNQLRPIAEEMDGSVLGGPTFFELTTALAWLYFVERQVDIVVLEVGLGGRLDATNLCAPLVTVITSISRDHTRILGDTLEAITGEKAGIIKPGVSVLTAVTDPGALGVIRDRAESQGSPCYVVGEAIDLQVRRRPTETVSLPHYEIDLSSPWSTRTGLQVPLPGEHQCRNAALAVSVIDVLTASGKFPVSEPAITTGLAGVEWPLRIEVISRSPWLILDAAHNEASITALVETLKQLPVRRRIAIFAAARDKDVPTMLKLIAGGFDEVILTQFLGNPRAVPALELQAMFETHSQGRCHVAETPADSLDLARSLAGVDDLICATGSFFLAGEVRSLLKFPVSAT